jgi:hypothetical protein
VTTGSTDVGRAVAVLPDGDLVVQFGNVLRWNGATWGLLAAVSAALDIATLDTGEIFLGNEAGAVGGYTWLRTNCPASLQALPTACAGGSGPVALAAAGPAWTGSTFASTANGFAANALAAAVVGLTSPQVPLATLHPSGLPACDLLASADAVLLVVPTAGVAAYTLAIPDTSALAGLGLFHQFLQVELDPQGGLAAVSSSNGLSVVVGTL